MLTVFLQDQESWTGSTGHIEGDSDVYGLSEDGDKATLCRRAHLHCNGILVCQFFDRTLFQNMERFEVNEDDMRMFWNHELDANQKEANSVHGILARYTSCTSYWQLLATSHYFFE